MKRLIAALFMLVIIIGLDICALKTVNGITNKTDLLIRECTEQYRDGQTVISVMTAQKLKNFWKQNESRISIFSDRDNIDKMSQSVVKIYEFSKNKSDTDFLAECSIAREILKEIKSAENPSIQSVF